jgi:carboxyl-terminal processing protease
VAGISTSPGRGGLLPTISSRFTDLQPEATVQLRQVSYDCDVQGSCTANHPGSSTPLLRLPLVVLTDRNCVSACDAFSGAVKDLHLSTLVGTRADGIAAGPSATDLLDDGSLLALPAKHELGTDHELINGIGVAPDYYLPLTAGISVGHDPHIAKALNPAQGLTRPRGRGCRAQWPGNHGGQLRRRRRTACR